METITIENIIKEKPLKNEKVIWLKSNTDVQFGELYLTANRIAYLKDANPFAGMLKFFIKSARSAILFNIELKGIKAIARAPRGINKNILDITYNNNLHVKFLVDSFEAWESSIKSLIA